MIARFFYAFLWTALLPLAWLRLLWRARKQPGYREHMAERFACYTSLPKSSHPIWIHAVSVGEMRAAQPLVRALREQWPDIPLLLTCMTPTGRDTAQTLYGELANIRIVYLPYDHPLLAARFFRHFRPRLGVIMETELWPGVLAAARDQQINVVLVNARLSARSAQRYARWPRATRATLGTLSAIAAQTEDDAQRLRALGAHNVAVTGNLKFDLTPSPALLELGTQFRQRIGNRPVWLLASSREGEESLWLDALAAQPALPENLLWIVVPRHPQRFDAVAELIRTRGLRLQRRSDGQAVRTDTQVWLGDSMGEMSAYYAAAQIVLMGGSWLPFGSQNLIEACAVGTPVLLGPHTFNFSQASALALEAGAARSAANLEAALPLALEWHQQPEAHARAAQAARAFARAHTGATARTVALLAPYLPDSSVTP